MDDTGLYAWGAYAMGVVLAITEAGLLCLRDRSIRQFLGWHPRARGRHAAPPEPSGASREPGEG